MKKLLLLAHTLMLSTPLLGLIGRCIDNSTHLTTRYDDKQYHYVECYCNCSDTLKVCPQCEHKHAPHTQTIISTPRSVLRSPTCTQNNNTSLTETPYAALTALVKRCKKE